MRINTEIEQVTLYILIKYQHLRTFVWDVAK